MANSVDFEFLIAVVAVSEVAAETVESAALAVSA